jgi:hypothetical protein
VSCMRRPLGYALSPVADEMSLLLFLFLLLLTTPVATVVLLPCSTFQFLTTC